MLGVHLSLMIGPTLPLPATADIAEAVQSVSVTQNDEGRSGFQIVLQVGRSGAADLLDYRLLQNPLLRPFNRVILIGFVQCAAAGADGRHHHQPAVLARQPAGARRP